MSIASWVSQNPSSHLSMASGPQPANARNHPLTASAAATWSGGRSLLYLPGLALVDVPPSSVVSHGADSTCLPGHSEAAVGASLWRLYNSARRSSWATIWATTGPVCAPQEPS